MCPLSYIKDEKSKIKYNPQQSYPGLDPLALTQVLLMVGDKRWLARRHPTNLSLKELCQLLRPTKLQPQARERQISSEASCHGVKAEKHAL